MQSIKIQAKSDTYRGALLFHQFNQNVMFDLRVLQSKLLQKQLPIYEVKERT